MRILEFLTSFIYIENSAAIIYIIGTIILCIGGELSYYTGGKFCARGRSGFVIWLIILF